MQTSKELHAFDMKGIQRWRINPELIRRAKIQGFSDFQIARAIGLDGDVEKGVMLVRPVPVRAWRSSGAEADRCLGRRVSGRSRITCT